MAWRILFREGGGFAVLASFALMHLAGLLDRRGWRRLADRLRGYLDLERIAGYCGRLLDTNFRFVVTEAGGCAVDIDNEEDFDVARLRYREWRAAQDERARALYGALALPARAGEAPELRVAAGGEP
jgi:hypothetical protein